MIKDLSIKFLVTIKIHKLCMQPNKRFAIYYTSIFFNTINYTKYNMYSDVTDMDPTKNFSCEETKFVNTIRYE